MRKGQNGIQPDDDGCLGMPSCGSFDSLVAGQL